ncbi:13920_t:CDS:2, partial [Dentiscutata heterogama]
MFALKSFLQKIINNEPNNSDICIICQDSISSNISDSITILNCHHIFHYDCIFGYHMHDYRPNICPICRNENVRSTLSKVSASSSTETQNTEREENERNELSSQYEGNEHYEVNELYVENGVNEVEKEGVQEFINEIVNPDIDEMDTDEEDEMEMEEEMSDNGQTISLQMLLHLYDHA